MDALLRSCPEAPASERLGEHRVARAHPGVGGRVGVRRLGADPQSAVRQLLDRPERQAADVDQVGRPLDLELHQVEQIGAAADELGAGPGRRGDRGPRVGRALVGEGSHLAPSFRDFANGRDDVRIGGAATDVAAHPLADLRVGQRADRRRHVGGGVAGPAGLRLGEHADGRADLAGRAVAALEGVVLDEGGLQRMQGTRRAQAFDRHDLVVLVHDGEGQARVDAPAVDQHGTGAALPVVAALLGAGQVQVLAQRVEQRGADIQLEVAGMAVDDERHLRAAASDLGGSSVSCRFVHGEIPFVRARRNL